MTSERWYIALSAAIVLIVLAGLVTGTNMTAIALVFAVVAFVLLRLTLTRGSRGNSA